MSHYSSPKLCREKLGVFNLAAREVHTLVLLGKHLCTIVFLSGQIPIHILPHLLGRETAGICMTGMSNREHD